MQLTLLLHAARASSTCKGGIRTMMITGDYHYTAIAVARDVGMVKPGGQVLIVETNGLSLLRSAMQSPLSAANTMAESKFTPHVSFARLSSNRAGHWGSAHDVDADDLLLVPSRQALSNCQIGMAFLQGRQQARMHL